MPLNPFSTNVRLMQKPGRTCIFILKNFASKNQLPGLSVSGTFVENVIKHKCLSNNVLNKVNLTPMTGNSKNKIYYGLSETKFKSRNTNHKKPFKNGKYKTDFELSYKIWKLKEQKKNVHISWEILGIHQLYSTAPKRCMLCLNQKLAMALHKQDKISNKCTEIIR